MVGKSRSGIEKNIYIQNTAMNILRHRSNERVYSVVRALSEIDPILDFGSFRKAITRLKSEQLGQGKTFGLSGIASESLLYGHLRSLVEYAGFDYEPSQRLLLPNIEHGVAWIQRVPANVVQPYVHCIVSQGSYRAGLIRSARPWLPQYVIGPYIHYAQPFYEEDQMSSIKKKWGKTLLVVPAHTYELSEISFGKERFVESVMGKYGSDFDTIVVSAYWHDADDILFDLFEQAGAIVVSSGMREDSLFISRLKALLLLSDAVVGNSLGTHIGYCMHLQKPFAFIGAEDMELSDVGAAYRKEEELEKAQIQRRFISAFSCFEDTQEKADEQRVLYDRYWGGEQMIKTKEEIKGMLDASEGILKRARGFVSRFPSSIEDAAKVSDGAGRILREALSVGTESSNA